MFFKSTRTLVGTAVVASLMTLSSASALPAPDGLVSTGEVACDAWSWDQIRCLVDGRTQGQTSRVIMKNLTSATVQLTWDEWHSTCGWAGGKVNSRTITLQPNEELGSWLQAPGSGITCREVFLYNCRSSAGSNCQSLLSARWESFIGNTQ